MFPQDQKRRHSSMLGVTLVELLTSVAIIGVLASITYSGYAKHVERVRVREAVTDIGRIQLAIAQYVNRSDRLAAGLPEDLAELGLSDKELTDPWGRTYRYEREGQFNRDYDLYSLGPDGTSGSAQANSNNDNILRGGNGSFIGTQAEYAVLAGIDTGWFSTPSQHGMQARDGAETRSSRFVR